MPPRNKRVISVTVDPEILEEADRFARMFGINRSEFIRRSLLFYMKFLRDRYGIATKYIEIDDDVNYRVIKLDR